MVVGCWVGLAFENGMVLKWLVGGLMLVGYIHYGFN